MAQWAWQRKAAALLMVVATIFWLWFGIGSAYVERLGAVNWVLHLLVPGGVFVLSTLIAWRWERLGGTLLVLEGLLALAFILRTFFAGRSAASSLILMCSTLGLPPLVAGILFILHTRPSHAR